MMWSSRVLVAFCLACGLLTPVSSASAASREPQKLVLIVGNNRHLGSAQWTLEYADDDALRAAEVFQTIDPAARIWVLTTLDAQTRGLREAPTALPAVMPPPSPVAAPPVVPSQPAAAEPAPAQSAVVAPPLPSAATPEAETPRGPAGLFGLPPATPTPEPTPLPVEATPAPVKLPAALSAPPPPAPVVIPMRPLPFPVKAPTVAGLEQAVDAMTIKAAELRANGQEVMVYFVFAGFGDPGGGLQLEDASLPMPRWQALLGKVGAPQAVALIEAFYPVQFVGTPRKAIPAPTLVLGDESAPDHPDWLSWVASTSPMQNANHGRGGPLIQVALSGLLGAGDLDGDARVTFFEWHRFITQQIDTGKPFSPDIRTARPLGDTFFTLANLRQGVASGLFLEPEVPGGTILVRREGDPTVFTRWYHYQGRSDAVRLPPGSYTFTRFSDRTPPPPSKTRKRPAPVVVPRLYPAEVLTVQVEPSSLVHIDQKAVFKRVIYAPPSSPGGRKVPTGAEIVPMSEEDELELISLPYRVQWKRRQDQLPALWSLSARLTPPAGLSAGTPASAPDPDNVAAVSFFPAPLAAVRFARINPSLLRSRWSLGSTFLFQYGVSPLSDLTAREKDGELKQYPLGLYHQLRLGPGLTQVWIGPRMEVRLAQTVSYAPGMVTAGGQLLRDEVTEDAARPQDWANLFLTDVNLELELGLTFPLGRSLELGPSLSLLGVLFHKDNPWGVSYTGCLGLELRQRSIR